VDHQLPPAVHFNVYISEQLGCVEELAFIFQYRSAMTRQDHSAAEHLYGHTVVREGFEVKFVRQHVSNDLILAQSISACSPNEPAGEEYVRVQLDL
jgi:hypothetical protein